MIKSLLMLAAVPLYWEATPLKPAPATFDRFHGESLAFRCTFTGFGALPFDGASDVRLWYQTNGMGAAWWSLPASVSSNVLAATFTPDLDPGTERLSVFFGAPSNAYAAAQVRFRNSPGVTPNNLVPPSIIDWQAGLAALSNALAASVYTKDETDAAIAAKPHITTNDVIGLIGSHAPAPGDYATVSNRAMSALTRQEAINGFTEWTVTPPTYNGSKLTVYWNTSDHFWELLNESGINVVTPLTDQSGHETNIVWDDGEPLVFTATRTRLPTMADIPPAVSNVVTKSYVEDLGIESGIQDETDPVWESEKGNYATKQQLQAVSNEAQVAYRLFSGSNVVAEVTNYNSQVNAPQLRLLQLNESNEYFTVWSETNGLARTLAAANSNANEQVAQLRGYCETNYAPRAWSRTTSGLGAEAPSNTTWISTPTTVIAGGLEYAKVVHANGAIWVLSGNGMMHFDPTTNAYLRISADDGTDIFSIEKTDALTLGADAAGIEVDGTVRIPVPVVSANPPTMYWKTNLAEAAWHNESEIGSVADNADICSSWRGAPGAWTNVIDNADVSGHVVQYLPPSMFFKFTYEQEGATVIRNNAAVDVSGGILCTDGVHKVRPVYSNGSITWEVVE